MLLEYCPNSVLPILLPSITPSAIEITENIPIEMEVKSGETPVIPAPKPIVKQFSASTNPKKIDSLKVIFFALFKLTNTERVSVIRFDLFLSNKGEVMINQTPRPIIREPPI